MLKSYYNQGVLDPPLYFYRDKDQREIDLLMAEGDMLYPLEIRKHADPKAGDIASGAAKRHSFLVRIHFIL